MKLSIVGSADAFNSSGRGHSCYLLESPGCGAVMLDFGPTALAGLRRLGRQPNEIAGIAVTHLHGDHIGGLPFLLIDALYNSARPGPLPVLGPIFTRDALAALVTATYADVKDALEQFPLPVEEFVPGEERLLAGYRVTAFAAEHMHPPQQPLCLRFEDAQGTRVAFSGDTRLCPGLFAAAQDTDLLVAECTRMAPPAGSHCTWQEWVPALPKLGTKRLLLSHLGADVRERIPELLASVDASIQLGFADDGQVIEL